MSRIRLTNPKTGETMTVAGVPNSSIPWFAVQLGQFGILVSSIPDQPAIPICRCKVIGGVRLPHIDCDEHGLPAVQVEAVELKPEPPPQPGNPFAEALFQVSIQLMKRDRDRLRREGTL